MNVRTDAVASPHATSAEAPKAGAASGTAFGILLAISASHLLNDLIQALVPSIYPILKDSYALDFGQIGLITLVWQLTASILQPIVGTVTDRHPQPFSLPIGMVSTLCGLLVMAFASGYSMLLIGAALIGIGSSIFHPDSSRVARLASGGRHGLAQSVFQVGGNLGSAIGPLLAAIIILPRGLQAMSWFSVAALAAILLLTRVGFWYRDHRRAMATRSEAPVPASPYPKPTVALAISVLLALVFSKFVYMTALSTYYTFYLIETFRVSVGEAQIYLFVLLAAVAVGTIAGGPIGDRIGRRRVIWFSILGILPFTLALPFVDLFWTAILSAIIGFVLASAFPAIIVYAQELLPGRVGMVSGLFFGLAFGIGGLGAAILGEIADHTSIGFVYRLCAFLPAIGLLAVFLPEVGRERRG